MSMAMLTKWSRPRVQLICEDYEFLPASPDSAEIEELQRTIDKLTRERDQLAMLQRLKVATLRYLWCMVTTRWDMLPAAMMLVLG